MDLRSGLGGTMLFVIFAAAGCAGTPGRPSVSPGDAAASRSDSVSVPPIDYKKRTLKNGLTVYSLYDPGTPNVAVSVFYEVGGKHDPGGRAGFAHLFEHLLSRKTVNMPYNMINRLVEEVGGTRNATTGYDRTRYFEIVPAQYLERMLWTHAERMARPVLDQAIFDNERMAVNQEYHEFTVTPPYMQLYREVIPESTFDLVPHRRPVIGVMENLAAATLDDALAFHEAYYGPDTASLFVSGNFDQARLDAWVDRYFAGIPPRPRAIPVKIEVAEPPRTAPRLVRRYVPNVALPAIATSWKIPGYAHPDVPAVAVIDAVLTRGRNSRLYRGLVGEQPLATQVTSMFSDLEEIGHYSIVALLAEGAAIEKAEAVVSAEMARLRDEPVAAAELTEAKNELVAASLRQRETYSNRANEMAEALVKSGDPQAADKRLAAIQNVTAADVQRVARQYLAAEARVDIRYMNEKERPAGEADGWRNPVPMPKFGSVPPATRPAHQAAEDAQREAPPAEGRVVAVKRPSPSQTALPNGLRVVTAGTTNVPLAAMTLAIQGGTSTDPAGKSGVATLVAELVTRGTKTRTAQQIAAEIESLGATLTSTADVDGIVVSVSAPTANLEAAGRVLRDVAQNAVFPAEELERARKRAIDRVAVSMKDPGAVASWVIQRALYGSAPYGNVPSGTAASLRSLAHADLVQHFREWWHPANAGLVIAGGIEPAAATQLARDLFGDWQGLDGARTPPAERAGVPAGRRTIVVDIPGSPQTAVVVGLRGVGRADPAYSDVIVANAILGGNTTSRLFDEVRLKRGLSYSVASWMFERMDDAPLTGWAQTKSERAPELLNVLLAEFERMAREPLSPDAIEKRKAFMTGFLDRQLETSSGFAGFIASLLWQGLPPEEVTRYAGRIAAVTAATATSTSARLFAPEATTVVVVGDASKVVDALRKLRPETEVIAIDQLDLDSAMLRAR